MKIIEDMHVLKKLRASWGRIGHFLLCRFSIRRNRLRDLHAPLPLPQGAPLVGDFKALRAKSQLTDFQNALYCNRTSGQSATTAP
jgi:hypothetical protein